MPSTITSYFEFSVGTKARSSEVNTNFSNHRGTLVPINPDTASSSHLTHDIGSSEHRWNVGYFGTLDMQGATTTAALKWDPDTANTLGSLDLLAGSTTLTNAKFGSFGFAGHTTTEFTKFQYQTTTGGNFDLIQGSTTITTYTTLGVKHRTKAPLEWTTSSAPLGTCVITNSTSMTLNVNSAAAAYLTIGSVRMFGKGGGIVQVTMPNLFARMSSATATSHQYSATIHLYRGQTTTAFTYTGQFLTYNYIYTGTVNLQSQVGDAQFYDNSYSSGEIVYEFRLQGGRSFASAVPVLSLTTQFMCAEL